MSSTGRPEQQASAGQSGTYGTKMVEAPDTGWEGRVPSKEGGEGEVDYLHKPPYYWRSDRFRAKYSQSCHCRQVRFEYHGDPVDAKYCHCKTCQKVHGAPFQWAVLYHKTSVRLADESKLKLLDFYSTTKNESRHDVPCKVACNKCRSLLLDEGKSMVMAYPPSFDLEDKRVPRSFKPTAHIFYGERVMDVTDGVPKWSGHKGASELLAEESEEGEREDEGG